MTSLPSKKTTETKGEKAAYEAFNAVDKLVSKPVMGSDGASRWQNFRADNKQIYELARPSVAPVAPLKVSDRKAGFGSWNEERQNEVKVRTTAGDAALNAGYTNFQHKNSQTAEEVARKKHEKQVRKRVRPEEEPYYIKPADDGVTFQGHKFDYIFTTKDKKTGYYWDGMDSVKKLDQGDSPADTSIHMKKQEKTSSSSAPTETNSATEQPKKKKRKKVKQAVIIDDPNNPMEQVAAAIQRRQLAATGATGGGGGDVAWETALDPTSGKTYYFCRATGERKWEKPEPETLPLPQGWQSAKDPNTGKEYFYHAATAETRWERPPNANR
jgi:hypothetical protein